MQRQQQYQPDYKHDLDPKPEYLMTPDGKIKAICHEGVFYYYDQRYGYVAYENQGDANQINQMSKKQKPYFFKKKNINKENEQVKMNKMTREVSQRGRKTSKKIKIHEKIQENQNKLMNNYFNENQEEIPYPMKVKRKRKIINQPKEMQKMSLKTSKSLKKRKKRIFSCKSKKEVQKKKLKKKQSKKKIKPKKLQIKLKKDSNKKNKTIAQTLDDSKIKLDKKEEIEYEFLNKMMDFENNNYTQPENVRTNQNNDLSTSEIEVNNIKIEDGEDKKVNFIEKDLPIKELSKVEELKNKENIQTSSLSKPENKVAGSFKEEKYEQQLLSSGTT